jgi:hypothetical protein
VISKNSIGAESKTGLIGVVVKVVCMGCHHLVCGGGIWGVVRVFFRMGALFSV